ncbi:unnamed protein product, partial [Nesidiocoris tenuis]
MESAVDFESDYNGISNVKEDVCGISPHETSSPSNPFVLATPIRRRTGDYRLSGIDQSYASINSTNPFVGDAYSSPKTVLCASSNNNPFLYGTSNGYDPVTDDVTIGRETLGFRGCDQSTPYHKSRAASFQNDIGIPCARAQPTSTFALSFRDVEGAITKFEGNGSMPVDHWIKDFESMAELCGWDDLQKFIFAKRSLTGVAQMFVNGEPDITSWDKLRTSLEDEFRATWSVADIHKTLQLRKKTQYETPYEYFLMMRELSKGLIDDESLIHYVITGIQDLADQNMLYGASSLADFKRKLRIYEKCKADRPSLTPKLPERASSTMNYRPPAGTSATVEKTPFSSWRKCYNCGQTSDHLAKDCPKPRRPPGSCFGCASTTHLFSECPNRRSMDTPGLRPLRSGVNFIDVDSMAPPYMAE